MGVESKKGFKKLRLLHLLLAQKQYEILNNVPGKIKASSMSDELLRIWNEDSNFRIREEYKIFIFWLMLSHRK